VRQNLADPGAKRSHRSGHGEHLQRRAGGLWRAGRAWVKGSQPLRRARRLLPRRSASRPAGPRARGVAPSPAPSMLRQRPVHARARRGATRRRRRRPAGAAGPCRHPARVGVALAVVDGAGRLHPRQCALNRPV
jgi:hypothetical protein